MSGEASYQRCDDMAEVLFVPLNRQEDRDGVSGPRADLRGAVQAKIVVFPIQPESFADGPRKFRPVQLPNHDILGGEFEDFAASPLAPAAPQN